MLPSGCSATPAAKSELLLSMSVSTTPPAPNGASFVPVLGGAELGRDAAGGAKTVVEGAVEVVAEDREIVGRVAGRDDLAVGLLGQRGHAVVLRADEVRGDLAARAVARVQAAVGGVTG